MYSRDIMSAVAFHLGDPGMVDVPRALILNRVNQAQLIITRDLRPSNMIRVASREWSASQEIMPNQVDRDFSGASAWANVDIDSYDETGDLSLTASAADQYCTLAVASAPTGIGNKYKLTFDVDNMESEDTATVGGWGFQDYTGAQVLGVVEADGDDITLEWTAETTGGLRIVALSSTSTGDFDNFSLTSKSYLIAGNTSTGFSASDFLVEVKFTWDGYELPKKTINDIDEHSSGTSTPGFYCIYGGLIQLGPLPPASSKLAQLYYVKKPGALSGTASESLDLPDEYHQAVELLATYLTNRDPKWLGLYRDEVTELRWHNIASEDPIVLEPPIN